MDDDSTFLALIGYAGLALIMVGSYVIARQVDQEWFCFVWLSTIVVSLIVMISLLMILLRLTKRHR